MKVTPLDIRRKEFRRSVRGYLDEDVDVFLDTVADEYERVSKVNADLQAKVRSLEEQVSGHTQIREAVEKTLVAAQLQSDEIRSKAQNESQSMLHDAEAKAKAVVDDFYAQTCAVQQTLIQLKLLEEDFRFKFKALLEGYIKLVDEGPILLSGLENDSVATKIDRAASAPSAAQASAAKAGAEVDDNPTSETAAAVRARQAAAVPRPPHLPKGAPAAKTATLDSEDLTVETPAVGAKGRPAKAGKAETADGSPDSAAGVRFGRSDDDADDPFPEIGGSQGKARDFEW